MTRLEHLRALLDGYLAARKYPGDGRLYTATKRLHAALTPDTIAALLDVAEAAKEAQQFPLSRSAFERTDAALAYFDEEVTDE